MSNIQIPIGSWHARLIAFPCGKKVLEGAMTPLPDCDKPCYEIIGPDGWRGWWYIWGTDRQATLEFIRWLFPTALASVEETVCTFGERP